MDALLRLTSLLGFAILIGVQHGFDVDHVAAISDIVASQKVKRKAIGQAILYGAGHALVVVVLGILAVAFGKYVPSSIDTFFGGVIGITLICLGVYVLAILFRKRSRVVLQSRWMLLYQAFVHLFNISRVQRVEKRKRYGSKVAFGIGMVHGVGAETPTQITALVTLAGIRSEAFGMFFLGFFVAGLFASNVAIALLARRGMNYSKKRKTVLRVLSFFTALFSIAVGVSFLFN